jgi:large subunit ribosomal protein L4
VVVEDITFENPKTRQFTDIIKGLDLSNKKTLFITPEYDSNVYLSLRNLPTVKGTMIIDMNTYDIMNANVLVFTEGSLKSLAEEEVVAEAGA